MSEEKTMRDRVGKDYLYILEKICGILRHYQKNFYIDDKAIEKIEELCLGIETGKMEIIEFGQVLSKRNNVDKYKKVLDKIKEYCNHKLEMLELQKRNIMQILIPENGYLKTDIEIEMQKYKDILELLEEIE